MTDAAGGRAIGAASISAAIAVALGAFAAHALEGRLAAREFEIFETAVRYHFFHALGGVGAGLALDRRAGSRALDLAGLLFLAGTALFSGSLYVLALTGAKWLGAVTPFGGVAFIAGWVALALGAVRGAVSPSPR